MIEKMILQMGLSFSFFAKLNCKVILCATTIFFPTMLMVYAFWPKVWIPYAVCEL
jgi:hypothetical protein